MAHGVDETQVVLRLRISMMSTAVARIKLGRPLPVLIKTDVQRCSFQRRLSLGPCNTGGQ